MDREATLDHHRALGKQIRSQFIRATRALTGWAPEGKTATVKERGCKQFKWDGLHARISWGPTSDDPTCSTVYISIIGASRASRALKEAALEGFTYMRWAWAPGNHKQLSTLNCWITLSRECWPEFAGLEL